MKRKIIFLATIIVILLVVISFRVKSVFFTGEQEIKAVEKTEVITENNFTIEDKELQYIKKIALLEANYYEITTDDDKILVGVLKNIPEKIGIDRKNIIEYLNTVKSPKLKKYYQNEDGSWTIDIVFYTMDEGQEHTLSAWMIEQGYSVYE